MQRQVVWLMAMLIHAAPVVTAAETVDLATLERAALERNPTLVQAGAAAAVSAGRREQAGVGPSPEVGYSVDDVRLRAPSATGLHSLFVEQRLLLGGQLRARQRVFAAEQEQAEAELEAQALRVLATVRGLYYEALAGQEELALRRELAAVGKEAVTVTQQMYNIGQADQPDVLEIAIEAQQMEAEGEQAETRLRAAWSQLAALTGRPEGEPPQLAGSVAADLPRLDLTALRAELLQRSPQVQAAKAGVARAEAEVGAARAEGAADLRLRGSVGYDVEREAGGGRGGWTVGLEAGVGLPRSTQGAVSAARAEVLLAQAERRRLELRLAARFDAAAARYQQAQRTAERYRTQIIPLAEQSLAMFQNRFAEMAAAYPQVLIARRRLAQLRLAELGHLTTLRREAVALESLLLMEGWSAPPRAESSRDDQASAPWGGDE